MADSNRARSDRADPSPITINPADFTLSADDVRESPDLALQRFDKYGVLRVKELLNPNAELDDFKQTLIKAIKARLSSLSQDHSSDDIDALFNNLCNLGRHYGSEIYDVARETDNFHELIRHPELVSMCRALLGTDYLHMPFDKAMFRIDRPNESWSEFHWHQDYSYNVMSHRTITVWAPLTDVTLGMGALRLIPGSHTRHYTVQLRDKPALKGVSKYRAAYIYDFTTEELDGWSIPVPVAVGDVLFFHELMLHRSGHNTSDQSRWVYSGRYGNFLDRDLVRRGWKIERSVDFSVLTEVEEGAIVEA